MAKNMAKNKVITLSDSNYFKYGDLFLLTRKLVDADFILYGPELTRKQHKTLDSYDIEYRHIDKDVFKNQMQFLKFELIKSNIDTSSGGDYGVTLVDFDTFFIKDWSHVFNKKFDLGVTVRNDFVKQKIYRAYANGGVVFARNTQKTYNLCEFAINVMKNGGDDHLKEYDYIFKTFEPGSDRPSHKVWSRENLRWWVDQVFLSSLVLYEFNRNKRRKTVKDSRLFDFHDYSVGLFSCNIYNKLDPKPVDVDNAFSSKGSVHIMHMKTKGRSKINSLRKRLIRYI